MSIQKIKSGVIADDAVTEVKIPDGAVTDAKLTLAANSSAIKTALNASGEPGIYAARAWVNFDGTTSPGTIRGSGNVSSVTRNTTGQYTVNFANAMPDENYTSHGTVFRTGSNTMIVEGPISATTTTAGIFVCRRAPTATIADCDIISLTFFR